MFGTEANCEYVWNSVSVCRNDQHRGVDVSKAHTCVSNARACCRSCAQPVPVEEAIVLLEGYGDIDTGPSWFPPD
jgi:hypothetical protein